MEERLVYRGDFALGTLMRFLPIVTQIFLWYAIFDAAGKDEIVLKNWVSLPLRPRYRTVADWMSLRPTAVSISFKASW